MAQPYKTNDLLFATYLRLMDRIQGVETYIRPMPDPESSNQRQLYFYFNDAEEQRQRLADVPQILAMFFDIFHENKRELNTEIGKLPKPH